MERKERGYLPGQIFKQPSSTRDYDSPYVMPSEELNDLLQKNRDAVTVFRLPLATAGSLWIQKPGYHFCGYGDDGDAIRTIDTTAFVNVFINKGTVDPTAEPFPAKHARGFSSPFAQLYLTWPAQPGVYMNFVVFHSKEKPWIDGESGT